MFLYCGRPLRPGPWPLAPALALPLMLHRCGYLSDPMQNVHMPLEAPPASTLTPAGAANCDKIPNADRKTYCQMAAVADTAIGNLTRLLDATFAGEDMLMVVSGDNVSPVNGLPPAIPPR